eukprot:15970799-Heterocapsa_arctica.AAC.1
MECSWWFRWPPGKPLYFTKPNGYIVRFYVHNNVPYLDEESVTLAPADEIEAGDGAEEVSEIPPEDQALGEVGGAPPMD